MSPSDLPKLWTASLKAWTSHNSDFPSHFSVLKIGQIVPKKISVKYIGVGDQLLLTVLSFLENYDFKILYFLKMCPIFLGSVHNFGRSEGDII